MNEAETTLFLQLMERFLDVLSAAGCNDLDVPATPENAEVLRAVIAQSDYPDEELKEYNHYRSDIGKYYSVMDSELLRYLVRKITGKDIGE